MHDEKRCGRPSLVTDDFVQKVEQFIREDDPPYSPNLAFSFNHLFTKLKDALGEKRFEDDVGHQKFYDQPAEGNGGNGV